MLSGKLVNLRAYELDDLEDVMDWVNNQEIRQYLTMIYPYSRFQEREILQKFTKPDPENIVLAIETREKIYIGSIGLHNIHPVNRNAVLGIVIGKKEYWNKGYGTDAMMTILDYAFNQLNLHRVYLHVYDFNKRGIGCYEKCGFKMEGKWREHAYKNGKYVDDITMGLLKKDFIKRKKK